MKVFYKCIASIFIVFNFPGDFLSITHRWHYQFGVFFSLYFEKPWIFILFLYFWIILNLKWKWECVWICHFNALCPTVYIVYMARYKLVMPDSVFSSSIVLSTHQLTQQSYKKKLFQICLNNLNLLTGLKCSSSVRNKTEQNLST